jgi:hypothetical protein
MEFQYKLLNDQGRALKKLDKAMWLLFGNDLSAEPRTIGDRNKTISDVELRMLMDAVVYERYTHHLTTPTRHVYAWVEGDAENAGAEEVDVLENGKPSGFKTYMQISIDGGVKSLSKFEADPDFPNGPTLRIKKHARLKVLLEDMANGKWCHKIYIAHKRQYIGDGEFLTQMDMALDGDIEGAWKIRCSKIRKKGANRKLYYTARGNGQSTSGNVAQVQEQMPNAFQGEPVKPAPETLEADPETGEIPIEPLIMLDYITGNKINMFDLPTNRYTVRMRKTPGTWDWNPTNPVLINDWTTFAKAGYKIDLADD